MALFPKASFQVLVNGGVLMPGTRVEGTLVVTAPDPIPRAEHVDLVFTSTAEAGYGSGKSRSVERKRRGTSSRRGRRRRQLRRRRPRRPRARRVPATLRPSPRHPPLDPQRRAAAHDRARAGCAREGHRDRRGDRPSPLPRADRDVAARMAGDCRRAERVPRADGPSLHGLAFRARVLDGEERVIGATIRTRWTKSGPTTHVDIDLKSTPLPKAAWAELESETLTERIRAVRAVFPSAHVMAQGEGATLDRPERTPDPRALLSAIETFFAWVLEARGERRQDMPYR